MNYYTWMRAFEIILGFLFILHKERFHLRDR